MSRSSRSSLPPDPRTALAALDTLDLLDQLGTRLDGAHTPAVESSSGRQKGVGPGREPEADEDESAGQERNPIDEPSVSAAFDVVKGPAPPLRRPRVTEIASDPAVDSGRPSSADGRIVALRGYRPSLDGIATEFELRDVPVGYDVSTHTVMVREPPPWADADDPHTEAPIEYPHPLTKTDESQATRWLIAVRGGEVGSIAVGEALRLVAMARKRRYNPLATALRALVWDGIPRLDGLAAGLGLANDPVTRAAVVHWWRVSVARLLTPGTPLEDVLLVENASDVRAMVRALVDLLPGLPTLDTGLDFDPRYGHAVKKLAGRALVCVSDAAHFTVRELEVLTSFAGRGHDAEDAPPRSAAFALISSEMRKEHIPGRCVPVTAMGRPPALDATLRTQWLAEAVALATTPPESRARPALYRGDEDLWEVPIRRWLFRNQLEFVTTGAILRDVIGLALPKQEKRHDMSVAKIFRGMGWVKSKERLGAEDGRQQVRGWSPPPGFYLSHDMSDGVSEGNAASESTSASESSSTQPETTYPPTLEVVSEVVSPKSDPLSEVFVLSDPPSKTVRPPAIEGVVTDIPESIRTLTESETT